jgi:hypothetical protein
MKQLSEIFTELFTAIHEAVDENNFFACANISLDFIAVAELASFKDGVFIGEVFEGVFSQLKALYNEYVLGDEEFGEFKELTKQRIQIIANSYQKSDKNEVYEALRDIRNDVTVLQMKTFRFYESKLTDNCAPVEGHCCGSQ